LGQDVTPHSPLGSIIATDEVTLKSTAASANSQATLVVGFCHGLSSRRIRAAATKPFHRLTTITTATGDRVGV
jgi:hypothetical protein